MKKNIIYSLFFTALVLSGCKGDYDDWAAPQGFDAEEPVDMSLTATSVSSINMADVESETIALFSATADIPSGAEVTAYKAMIDGTKELAVDMNGHVNTAELTNTVVALYGKRPVERALSVVVYANVKKEGHGFLLKSDPVAVNVTLAAPDISDAYYLVGDMLDIKDTDGNTITSGWSADGMKAFNHSGQDVYEDPVFTLVFTATADNQYWKIIPKSNIDTDDFWANPGVVGVETDGDTSPDGTLTNKDAKAGLILKAGMYKMTLNMMDYTYTIQELSFEEFIYIPGNHQSITASWAVENAPALRSPGYDGVYTGFSYLNENFKFTKARNWDAEYNWNDFTTVSDGLINDEGTNINMTVPGFYYIEANLPDGKLTASAVSWGIVGPATSAAWDATVAPDMIWNPADESWSITAELNVGELKFVANKDWGINLGGTKDDLSQDGENLKIDEAGTYTIKLYTTRCASDKIYYTIEKVQ
ncbi:DUF5115 domain-containing protein [Massilibacteroides sp.]|uniref:Outer membrane protein SusF domain-containing protein n=1 Tax=Massilibacteroides sp. TaxID=2034766 RepID=UPI002601DBAE|nr:DUF5115 domain-containing protein [Massilibacteroides sp.]MDD4515524.1 DUF5115 domain-containing protein [Massilibacteroides sp.]